MKAVTAAAAFFLIGSAFGANAQIERDRDFRSSDRGAERDRGPRDQAKREAFRKAMLEKFDANGDGELDETERQTAHEAMRAHHEEMRANIKAKLIEKFDADGDGELKGDEREEAGRAMHRLRHAKDRRHDRRQRISRHLKEQFDTNEDGKLDETERAALKSHMQAKKAEIVERFDADGNGKLEGDERVAVKEYMKAQHESRRLDINRDGVVNEQDVQAAVSRVSEGERIPDFNKDGQIDAADVNELIERVKNRSN
ncbi:MAG: hypothetical protein Phyf2KO_17170 [Phycisphaerales bacterium]